MLWKNYSRALYKTMGRTGLKKIFVKYRRTKKNVKLLFNFVYRNYYFNKILRKSIKNFINLYVQYIYNAFANFYHKYCNASNIKLYIYQIFFNNKIENRRKVKKKNQMKEANYGDVNNQKRKKNKKLIKSNTYKSIEDLCRTKPNDHYIITLYNGTHLQNDHMNSSVSKNKTFKCKSNDSTTHSSDYSRNYENNDEINSSSCLENEILSFETLEYDEDEANEIIKNCYLYNGYVDANTYKNSDEYKFLKDHIKPEKKSYVNIDIDMSSQCYDEQVENYYEKDKEQIDQNDKENKNILRKRKKLKQKRIYEIYNSEITNKENMYYENYLNENYTSSYNYTSEDSNDYSCSTFTDNELEDNFIIGLYGNNFRCNFNSDSCDNSEIS
ncbi:conserved Plasmodium protein, unknown function [Plasmodium reichenowi]|uniref:Uncharacterized protein n=1 Tax=Plasmodium reichenowi TaxID=5854 RepID=A0A060RWD2_PLARE|nr:conserved Plasmodium protein, unknown function [Plasmodium reichenowi]